MRGFPQVPQLVVKQLFTLSHIFSYKIPFDDFYEIQRQNFQNYTII